jgi:hypothetical protein
VLHRFGAERAGQANGIIARAQQLARAGGPITAAALAGVAGYSIVFGVLAVALLIAIHFTRVGRGREQTATERREAVP